MRYKALFLDFYGTLVAEDDAAVAHVVKTVAEASLISKDSRQIGQDWFAEYERLCTEGYGANFKTQREINVESVTYILRKYQAELDAVALSQGQFTYWGAPEMYADGDWLAKSPPIPVCIVSNIDTRDLNTALQHVGWQFEHVLTSEDCRSYKPRPELFGAALAKMNVSPAEVLHCGDSYINDVTGAHSLGIDTAWINRKGKAQPNGVTPTYTVSDFRELMRLIGFSA